MFIPKSLAFPPPEEMQEHYPEYLQQIIVLPAILFTIGVLIALSTCCILSCGCTGHHCVHGKGERVWGAKPPIRPSSSFIFVLGFLIIAIVTFATIKRFYDNMQLVALVETTIGHVYNNSDVVATQAVAINTTVTDFFMHVGMFVAQCSRGNKSWVKPIMKWLNVTEMIEMNLEDYKKMVNNYSGRVENIPGEIALARDWVEANSRKLSFAPNIPLLVLGTICIIILGEALITISCKSSSCAKCVDVGLRISAIFFVLIILVVAVTVAVSSTMAITFSHFCREPEINTLEYVKYYANSSTVEKATQFYLQGDVINPIQKMAQLAKKYIVGLKNVYQSFDWVVHFAESLCSKAKWLNITTLADESLAVLTHANEILKGSNIWPFYTHLVRSGVCGNLVASLSLMVIFQCTVGLILFPICAVLTHRFLAAWSDWEQYVEDGGESDSEKASILEDQSDEDEKAEE